MLRMLILYINGEYYSLQISEKEFLPETFFARGSPRRNIFYISIGVGDVSHMFLAQASTSNKPIQYLLDYDDFSITRLFAASSSNLSSIYF